MLCPPLPRRERRDHDREVQALAVAPCPGTGSTQRRRARRAPAGRSRRTERLGAPGGTAEPGGVALGARRRSRRLERERAAARGAGSALGARAERREHLRPAWWTRRARGPARTRAPADSPARASSAGRRATCARTSRTAEPRADALDVADRLAQPAVLVEVAAHELERRGSRARAAPAARGVVGLAPARRRAWRAPNAWSSRVGDVGEADLLPARARGSAAFTFERNVGSPRPCRRAGRAVGRERRRRTRSARARSSGSCPAAGRCGPKAAPTRSSSANASR